MKNTVFLALAFAAIAIHAQKTYPECLLADCVNFLTITVGCGYSNTNVDITAAQLSCICGAPKGPAEYEKYVILLFRGWDGVRFADGDDETAALRA